MLNNERPKRTLQKTVLPNPAPADLSETLRSGSKQRRLGSRLSPRPASPPLAASGPWRTFGVRLWAFILVALSLIGSAVASATGWSHQAPLAIVTHEHAFQRVHAASDGCTVAVRLHLDAPEKAYAAKAPSDNYYAFLVRVRLSGGRTLLSPTLTNAAAGRRVLSFRAETDAEGCWASRPHKLRKVDVHACRGEGCTPRPF